MHTPDRLTLTSTAVALALWIMPALAAPPPDAGAGAASVENSSFYADRRAHRVGDVLTVLIDEAATVSESARTRTNKQSSLTGGVASGSAVRHSVGADANTDFNGGGQIDRSGRVLARLAVSVQGIDAMGNLSVAGEQTIVVNNEHQLIRLSGTVRAEDIGPDNTVASMRLGNAHIELSGKGILARRQSPGLLSRLFGWLIP